MKKVLLVKTENNWADEMDLSGFALFTPEKWQEYQLKIKKLFSQRSELTMSVGTNEEIDFNSLEDYQKQIKIKEISSAQAEIYCQHFDLKINELNEKNSSIFYHYGKFTLFSDSSIDYFLKHGT